MRFIARAAALAAGLVLLFAGPVSAAETFDPDSLSVTAVNPGNDMVLNTTPRAITIAFDDAAAASAARESVELTRAVSGKSLPPAGEILVDGNIVSFPPPSLEAGTYVVSWRTGGGLFTTEHRSVFSIGSPDTSVTGADAVAGSPLSWPARVAGVLASLAAGLLFTRRRAVLASAVVAVATAAMSVAVLPSGWLPTLVAAPGLVALGVVAGAALTKSSASTLLISSAAALFGAVLVMLSGVIAGGVGAFGSLGWVALSVTTVGLTLLSVALAAVGFAAARRGANSGRAIASVVTVVALVAGVLSVVSDPSGGTVLGGRSLQLNADVNGCLADGTTQDHRYCLEQLYTAKVETLGVPAALDDLAAQTKANPTMRSYCHEASHAIGRAALRVLGSVGTAFETGFDVCDFGYYHGIIEGAGGSTDDDGFRALVPSLCGDLASSSLVFFEQCAHGLGHAAARRANNDMIRGLEFCEALDDAKVFTESRRDAALLGCGTGVTMEWFALRGLSTADRDDYIPVVDNPRDACDVVKERWKASCYEYIGNLVNSTDALNSLAEIGAWCNASSYDAPCFKGIARAAAGLRLTDKQSISLCESAVEDLAQRECAAMLLYTYSVTVEFDVAAVDRLCAQFPTKWSSGPMCAEVRQVAVDSLTGVRDGKGGDRVGSVMDAPATS